MSPNAKNHSRKIAAVTAAALILTACHPMNTTPSQGVTESTVMSEETTENTTENATEETGSEETVQPVYCDIDGFEDFYVYPVTNCEGENMLMYVSHWDGDKGSSYSMDFDTGSRDDLMKGFQYRSVLAYNAPCQLRENISAEDMSALLDRFDFAVCQPDMWKRNEEISTDSFNRIAAALSEIELISQIDENTAELTDSDLNFTADQFTIEINKYDFYWTVTAEFFKCGENDAVMLTVDDLSGLYALNQKYPDSTAPYNEVKTAYENSCRASGCYLCSPDALDAFIGRNGTEPTAEAPVIYTPPTYERYAEDVSGKDLDWFLGKDLTVSTAEPIRVFNTGIYVPEFIDRASFDMGNFLGLYSKEPEVNFVVAVSDQYSNRLKELDEDETLVVEFDGTAFGNDCFYREYYADNRYCADFCYTVDGVEMEARATIYRTHWGTDYRPYFRGFFASITPAYTLPEPAFDENADEYFTSNTAESLTDSGCGISLFIPDGLETYSDFRGFTAQSEDIWINVSDNIGYLISDNFTSKSYQKLYAKQLESGNLDDFRLFERNGQKSALAKFTGTDFVQGRYESYTYMIISGEKNYLVSVTANHTDAEKSELLREILSSVTLNV